MANIIKLSTKLGAIVNKPKDVQEERSGSIVSALKKTATVALEIGGGQRTTNKLVDSANKLMELTKKHEGLETSGQDDVTGTRLLCISHRNTPYHITPNLITLHYTTSHRTVLYHTFLNNCTIIT